MILEELKTSVPKKVTYNYRKLCSERYWTLKIKMASRDVKSPFIHTRPFTIFFLNIVWYLCIFLPLPPLRDQPAVIMPNLLAPKQGMTCPCRLERCRIRTQDCRFSELGTLLFEITQSLFALEGTLILGANEQFKKKSKERHAN